MSLLKLDNKQINADLIKSARFTEKTIVVTFAKEVVTLVDLCHSAIIKSALMSRGLTEIVLTDGEIFVFNFNDICCIDNDCIETLYNFVKSNHFVNTVVVCEPFKLDDSKNTVIVRTTTTNLVIHFSIHELSKLKNFCEENNIILEFNQ